jgi:ATP synthase I chain
MIRMAVENQASDGSESSRQRIAWLTLILGFAAALIWFFAKSRREGAGLAIGTALAWLNYRWLDQGLGALVCVAQAQGGSERARVPAVIYLKFAGRYVLIALAIYVSLHYFAVPLVAMILGLLALGAGAFAESLYEIFAGFQSNRG